MSKYKVKPMDNDSDETTSPPPHSMVLYDNDEVVAVYEDGTCVKLSPCGANVLIPVKPPAASHPVNLSKQLHQRTQFVTHRHRRKVQLLLEFRNRFAEQLFLCKEVLGVENVVDFYADIKSVLWPTSPDSVTFLDEDGSVQLTSTDQCATIVLAPNRQEFSVRFLCKIRNVPQGMSTTQNAVLYDESNNNAKVTTVTSRKRLQDISHRLNFDADVTTDQKRTKITCNEMQTYLQEMSGDKVKTIESLRSSYAWQIQNYSVDHCPPNWLHPLKVLLKSSSTAHCKPDGEKGTTGEQKPLPKTSAYFSKGKKACELVSVKELNIDGNRSELPRSLPLRCPFSHMHQMSDCIALPRHNVEEESVWMEKRRIKVFFSRGVIFRVFWKLQPSLEIYPGDGSVLKSKLGSDKYFSFFCFRHGNCQEQLLSVKNPPPNSVQCGTHTLSSLLQRGHRLLCHMIFIERNTNHSPENICWKTVKEETQIPYTKPAKLLEESQIDGIGHFVAYSNGYIRVIFRDRTTVEFQVDLSDASSPFHHCKESKGAQHMHLFPANISRVLLRDGSEIMIDLRNPGQMERYTSIAIQWATWITLQKSQTRRSTHQDTLHDEDQIRYKRLAENELERLRLFTNSGILKYKRNNTNQRW